MMTLAAMALMNPGQGHYVEDRERERNRDRKAEQEKINLARGLKKFNIDGQEVWALNEKSARKKLDRRGT